jgi:hypothetical protein
MMLPIEMLRAQWRSDDDDASSAAITRSDDLLMMNEDTCVDDTLSLCISSSNMLAALRAMTHDDQRQHKIRTAADKQQRGRAD